MRLNGNPIESPLTEFIEAENESMQDLVSAKEDFDMCKWAKKFLHSKATTKNTG